MEKTLETDLPEEEYLATSDLKFNKETEAYALMD